MAVLAGDKNAISGAHRQDLADDVLPVAATFSAQLAVQLGSALFSQLALPARLKVASPEPIIGKLTNPNSDFRQANKGRVLIVRWEDLAPAGDTDIVQRTADELISGLKAASSDSARTLLMLCPGSSDGPAELAATTSCKNAFIDSRVVDVVVLEETANNANAPLYSESRAAREANIPYTDETMAVIASRVARWYSRFVRPPIKAIFVDGDQTLWSGVLGEDGISSVELTRGKKLLQEKLKKAAQTGVSLCLVTKNTEQDVTALLAQRNDFPLKEQDFYEIRAGWSEKSEEIRAIAEPLGIGRESILFIDDSPIECAEVRLNLPGIHVAQAPHDENIEQFTDELWLLDTLDTTHTDRLRQQTLLQEKERGRALEETASFAAFIRTLDLMVEIREASESDLPRLEQLALRTNQFNSTLNRYSLGAFKERIIENSSFVDVVDVRDRFGDYGTVGSIVYRACKDELIVDLFSLSCRALGRGVEHEIAAWLGSKALERGLNTVRIEFNEGPRNQPFLAFVESLPSARSINHGSASSDQTAYCGFDTRQFVLQASALSSVRFNPDSEQPTRPKHKENTASATRRESGTNERHTDSFYERLAVDLTDPHALMLELMGPPKQRPDLSKSFIPPSTKLEMELVNAWRSVLNLNEVGVFDDFAALGGMSIDAVRVFASIPDDIAECLSLADLFRYSTIRDLANYISKQMEPPSKAKADDHAKERGSKMRQRRLNRSKMSMTP